MGVVDVRRLRKLENESAKLKRLVADPRLSKKVAYDQ
jgi:hypothetical protein